MTLRRTTEIGLVFVGGVLGTAAREWLSLRFPSVTGVPYCILAINVGGAFLLGLLLEGLALPPAQHVGRHAARLLFGTGALGGFTTYSTLTVAMAAAITDGAVTTGVIFGIGSVLLGVAAAAGGVVVTATCHRHFTAGAR